MTVDQDAQSGMIVLCKFVNTIYRQIYDKKLCPVCDSNENEDEIHSDILSYLHNFPQLSYSDLIIKLI